MKLVVTVLLSAMLAMCLAKPAPPPIDQGNFDNFDFDNMFDFDDMFKFLDNTETEEGVEGPVDSIGTMLESLSQGAKGDLAAPLQAMMALLGMFGNKGPGGTATTIDSFLDILEQLWDNL